MNTPSPRSLESTAVRATGAAEPSWPVAEDIRSLLQAFHVGLMLNGPNGEILFINRAALRLFGVTEEGVRGKSIRDVELVSLREDGSECPLSMRPVARAIQTRQAVVGEVLGWHRRGSDSVFWTLISAVPQLTEDGAIREVVTTLTDITDRMNAEAALRRASDLNRQILRSAQEGIIVFDRELRYILRNPYMEQLTGVKESEVIGRSPLEVAPSLASNGIYAGLERALAGEASSSSDVYFTVPQTNRTGWCSNHFAPLRDAKGEVVGVVATVRDITDRKKAEERFRDNDVLLAQAEQLANMGSWDLNLETGMLKWSAHYYRLLGREPEPDPFPYCQGATVIHPDDYDRANREMDRLISTGQPLDNEMRIIRADGAERIFHSRAVAIANEAGRTIRVQGMSQDITERKNEEERLRKSEALLSQAEQIADFGSWETDLKTKKTTLSKNLLQVYGLSSESDWTPEGYWARVHPDDRARARKLIDEAVAECKPFQFRVRYRTPEWTYRVHLSRAVQIPGPDGRAERSIGVSHDITDHVRAEEELRELSGRLLKLQDETRRQIARDLHDSVSQRLLTISLNLARLAECAEIREEQPRQILANTREDIRDLSKEIRSLSYLLHPPLLDELGLVSAIEEYAKGFSERTGIELSFEPPADPSRLPSECELALFRVVQEALRNIQKHSGATKGVIRFARGSDGLVLEIADSGRGMAGQRLSKESVGAGRLGVGILGMRERMRQLGGRLEISSGEWGTEVKAVLPLQGQ